VKKILLWFFGLLVVAAFTYGIYAHDMRFRDIREFGSLGGAAASSLLFIYTTFQVHTDKILKFIKNQV